MEKITYGLLEVAKMFGIKTDDIYEMMQSGKLKAKEINGKPVITADSVKALMEDMEDYEPKKENLSEIENRIIKTLKKGYKNEGVILQRVCRKIKITEEQTLKALNDLVSKGVIKKQTKIHKKSKNRFNTYTMT